MSRFQLRVSNFVAKASIVVAGIVFAAACFMFYVIPTSLFFGLVALLLNVDPMTLLWPVYVTSLIVSTATSLVLMRSVWRAHVQQTEFRVVDSASQSGDSRFRAENRSG